MGILCATITIFGIDTPFLLLCLSFIPELLTPSLLSFGLLLGRRCGNLLQRIVLLPGLGAFGRPSDGREVLSDLDNPVLLGDLTFCNRRIFFLRCRLFPSGLVGFGLCRLGGTLGLGASNPGHQALPLLAALFFFAFSILHRVLKWSLTLDPVQAVEDLREDPRRTDFFFFAGIRSPSGNRLKRQ